jgi:hypothetical protein
VKILGSREEVKQKLLGLLKTVQSLEDVKKNADEIFDTMEEIMKLGLQEADEFFGNMDSMSAEEIQEGFKKFQSESYVLDEDIERELIRMDSVPGAQAALANYRESMNLRLAPFADRFENLISNNITKFPEPLRSRVAVEYGIQPGGGPGPTSGQRQRLEELEFVYNMNSIDDLKNGNAKLLELIKKTFERNIEELKNLKASGKPQTELRGQLDEIDRTMEVFGNELEAEIGRISKLPGAGGFIESFNQELMNTFQPLVMEFETILAELKGTEKPTFDMPPPQ